MITCQDIVDEASDFHDGDQDAARRQDYARHLELCPPCDSFYRSFEATIASARQAIFVDPPPELVEALIRGCREQIAKIA